MISLNRSLPPDYKEVKNINLMRGSSFIGASGIPFYYINVAESEVLRIDFVFNAGLRSQTINGLASTTNSLLNGGTSSMSSKEFADELDRFGAFMQTKTTADDAQVTLYCLPKFLAEALNLVYLALFDSTFPNKEVQTHIKNSKQRLLINQQKNSFLCRQAFYASIFGNQNAYGSSVNQDDYDIISRETIIDFYTRNYLSGLKYILVSGEVSEKSLACLDAVLCKQQPNKQAPNEILISPSVPQNLFIEQPNSVQSTIRVGRPLFNRTHTDFQPLQVLNLAFGGYFGSRLMKNLREEKGLTYGIYSSMESYWNAGCFFIETDINNDLSGVGIEEIKKEIQQIIEKPIPETELNQVRNYLIGSFLRSIDGPFSLADRYKTIIDYGITYEYYQSFVDTVKTISSQELLELANKYFVWDDFTSVVVGHKIQ